MLRHATVLIVDDLASSREVLFDMLVGEGYQLLMADGGAAGLELARRHLPDLILLDMMMPDVDGLTVCRRLRADPLTARVPVIFVTALDDRAARLAGIAAGCDDFISKPLERIELRLRVRTIAGLNRYRLLHDEQLRYERLFILSPNGLLIVDDQGEVRLANPSLATLTGVPGPEALAGRPLPALLAPEDRERCAAWLDQALAGRLSATHLVASLARPDGARLPVALDGGWFEWDGAPALQVIVRDMSDRRRAELLEVDRRMLAFDLHDDVAQTATAVYRQLEQLGRTVRPRRPEARAALERAVELTRRLMRDTRRLLAGLRPAALDDLGLVAALRQHVAELRADGMGVELRAAIGDERPPAPVETALFRIAQEALNNVGKHAGAAAARVELAREGALLRLTVEDDGPGLPADPASDGAGRGLGLRAMSERAAILGGTLRITSSPGAGTRVVAEVPLQAPPKE